MMSIFYLVSAQLISISNSTLLNYADINITGNIGFVNPAN